MNNKNILKDKNNSNYIKKYSAYEQYKDKGINNDLINFYYQFNHLKNIYRQGWLKGLLENKDITEIESIAEHSWSLSMLAITVIEKYNLNYDIAKCMKMSIIHELGEIYAGDFTPEDNITKERKHELEKKAIETLLNSISFDNDFLRLWEEYEKQETEEAKFIKQLDKLECIMQASCYGIDISYMKSSINNITLPYLKEILEEMRALTKNNKIPYILKNRIYKGTIVEQSLVNTEILEELDIINTKVSETMGWIMHQVNIRGEQIKKIKLNDNNKWYTHFWNNKDLIVVFKDRAFNINYDNKKALREIVEYGLSIGIPEEQLDFPID